MPGGVVRRATYEPEVNVLAVKIRLARVGAKKAPFYRIVAADSRSPRDGRFLEILGRYNPRTQPSSIVMDVEKVKAWIAKGAQPTETVAKLIKIAETPTEKVEAPKKAARPSKKAVAKVAAGKKAKAEAAAKPAKEPAAEKAPAKAEAVVEETPAAPEVAVEEPAAEAEAAAEEAPAEEPAAGEPAAE
jgi:small subunit ribosomal protein S16